LDGPRVSRLRRGSRIITEANQKRRYLLVWLCDVAGALDCDNPRQLDFSSRSKILSGEEPYSQMKLGIQVIRAIMGGSEPFREVKITTDDAYRQLSSRCLSREPEERPSVLEITTIVGGPAVIRWPSLCHSYHFSFLSSPSTGMTLHHSNLRIPIR
jgi:hypothetical protein